MTRSLDAAIPMEYNPRHVLLEAARPGPLDWRRRRRAEKEARRLAAAGQRAATRLDPWPDWHVVEIPRVESEHDDRESGPERAGFLAIGPGGVYAVSVLDHGRSRVLLAGDVVQISSGKRPPCIPQARREAKRASAALTRAVGSKVRVVPVLALVGTGPVTNYGLPKDCLVTTYQELDRVLATRRERITPSTAAKLSAVARHPRTWGLAEGYRWYPDGTAAGDKGRRLGD
jgi:hypothetical protein